MAETVTRTPHPNPLVQAELTAGAVERLPEHVEAVETFATDVVAKVRMINDPAFLAWNLRKEHGAGLWLTRVKRDSPSGNSGVEVRELVPWEQIARVVIVDAAAPGDAEPF